MPARLQEHYTTKVREALIKEFSYKNPLEVPRLDKIVINMGVGEAVNDRKAVDGAVKFDVVLDVPAGWKINPEFAMTYWLDAGPGAEQLIDRAKLGKRSLEKPAPKFTVSPCIPCAVWNASNWRCMDGWPRRVSERSMTSSWMSADACRSSSAALARTMAGSLSPFAP